MNRPSGKIFSGEATFMKGVVDMAGLPPSDLGEFAFAGRSNVGKSSILNALMNRKGLARTSNTPGRTQEVNFFDIGGSFRLVDLPGYGYARASRTKVDAWTELIFDYLRGRPNLLRVFVLIDSRHGIKPVDEEGMALLDESAVSYQVILTKIDKIKESGVARRVAEVSEALASRPAAHPEVLATSSEKGRGLKEVRGAILGALEGWGR
ncbi:YihA family ribosome biogenesis GTP-binding protein [Parvularcula sp. ZS-1/3]|uniref:Probable GTP-binding protein EngB n=1 Tax=Parvularcula mediterranea TaxID=2732508 RepID=A0A7Y3W4J6_9PROT|nr:ribosome biogenesis GTP-binding protein YihA/YsxC [Parvularcula mediterranea]NNU15306.1 YihA family ribosome biogenesis GTP-binding protein [Parvularcula mediterranea]